MLLFFKRFSHVVVASLIMEFCVGNVDQKHRSLVAQSRCLLLADTGYERPKFESHHLVSLKSVDSDVCRPEDLNYHELNLMTNDQLTDVLNESKDQLRCSFAFNALTHMRMCHWLFVGSDLDSAVAAIESYADTASTILGYLLGNRIYAVNEMWTAYVYAISVRRYKQLLEPIDDAWVQTLRTMHKIVMDMLEEVCLTKCPFQTVYNPAYTGSELYADYYQSCKTPVSTDDDERIREVIRKNAMAINRYHQAYRRVVWFRSQPKAERFYARFDDQMVRNFMTKFNVNVDWGTMTDRMAEYHEKSLTVDGPQNLFKYRRLYNRAFITLLRVVVLQLACKHLMYLKKMTAYQRISAGPDFNNVFSFTLMSTLSLVYVDAKEEEAVFEDIANVFNTPYRWAYLNTTAFNRQIATITGIVKAYLEPFGGKINEFIMDDDDNSPSYDAATLLSDQLGFDFYINRCAPIIDTVFTIDLFSKYLSTMLLNDADTTAIHSFGLLETEQNIIADYQMKHADRPEGVAGT